MMKYLLLIIIVSFLWMQNLAAETVIIVHKDVAESSISAKDAKDMYLDKKTTWTDGSKITLYLLKSGATHDDFLATHVKKSSSQFNAFWKQKVFTGKGRMPDEFENDAAMIKAVAAQVGAIGYVDKTSLANVEGVKIIEIK